jgi:lysophospholipase L1-like esterase
MNTTQSPITLLLACLACAATAFPIQATAGSSVHDMKPAPLAVGGRVALQGEALTYQWPGQYFESAFHGSSFAVSVGKGSATTLHVRVDGEDVTTLRNVGAGTYRIDGLENADHAVRVAVADELQGGPARFIGILIAPDATPLPLPQRLRRIEFIGDSHTVGYGALSGTRECTEQEVQSTTDNTRAYGPQVAHHYDADYRVHAISGRGVVRNYDGGAGDTLPQAYPFVLFDHSVEDTDTTWQPQVVVISLGTNDFSTPPKAKEKWVDAAALHADYERSYAAFVRSLRTRYPQAHVVLWATGNVRARMQNVMAHLKASGETNTSYLPIDGLTMGGCHWHPSGADQNSVANLLIKHLDALPSAPWDRKQAGASASSAR